MLLQNLAAAPRFKAGEPGGSPEERRALMVESRFFGGLDIPEIAQLLEVSEATILRDWRAAKAWLAHKLRQAR